MALELRQVGEIIPLDKIKQSGQKWRTTTADQGLEELGNSLVKNGQIHAISVVEADDGTFEVVNGNRRTQAARLKKIAHLRANVWAVPAGREDERELLIAQHLHAANMAEPLVPIERARMFEEMMRELDFDVDRLADVLEGEDAQTITDTMRFLNIDEEVLALIEANPDKFTEAHVRVLADYASPATAKAWRMKPEEQRKIALEIIEQKDKQVSRDPRKLQARIKSVVNERRSKEREKKAETKRLQSDPVKALFRAIEAVQASVRGLAEVDLRSVKVVEAKDKGDALSRVFGSIDELTSFAERLGTLSVRKAS